MRNLPGWQLAADRSPGWITRLMGRGGVAAGDKKERERVAGAAAAHPGQWEASSGPVWIEGPQPRKEA